MKAEDVVGWEVERSAVEKALREINSVYDSISGAYRSLAY